MCSLSDADLIICEEPVAYSQNDKCKKCDNTGEIVIRKRDFYCINCFTLTTNHKFRATLGKSKLIRANETVIVCISGGIASMVMLEFVRNGINADAHKKLRISPICIHIDESSIEKVREEKNEFILDACKEAQIPCYIVPISKYFDQNISLEANSLPQTSLIEDENIKALFDSVTSMTSKIELKMRLQTSLIVKICETLKCSFILTADTSTRLAATMLSDVSLGRGAHLESEVSFIDNRYPNTKLLRPMRDVTFEELNHIARIKNIKYLTPIHKPSVASLQGLIEKFVNELQEGFPATISTVCKTGEKLCDENVADDDRCCLLCQSKLDTQDYQSSALQATEFSHLVSSGKIKEDTEPSIEKCRDCTCSKNNAVTREQIEKQLCYGCRLVLKDIKSEENIPAFLVDAVKTKLTMESLRSEIEEFLL